MCPFLVVDTTRTPRRNLLLPGTRGWSGLLGERWPSTPTLPRPTRPRSQSPPSSPRAPVMASSASAQPRAGEVYSQRRRKWPKRILGEQAVELRLPEVHAQLGEFERYLEAREGRPQRGTFFPRGLAAAEEAALGSFTGSSLGKLHAPHIVCAITRASSTPVDVDHTWRSSIEVEQIWTKVAPKPGLLVSSAVRRRTPSAVW